jgi:O-antigen/teichoic acid export membrane protein
LLPESADHAATELMSIKRNFAVSSVWSVAGNAGNNLVGFAIFVILARLLEPQAIGLVAFALIFIEIGRIVVFGGLPEALIQRADWDENVASTCFTANLFAAVSFFALVGGIVAPILSAIYQPSFGPVLTSLSAIYIIDAGRAIHEAKLRREFRYKSLAFRASIANILSGGIGIGFALADYQVWALVIQRLCSAVLLTLLTWRAAQWRPRFVLSKPILQELSDFIIHLTPARILAVLTTKTVELVSGLVLGPSALAFYRVGSRGLEAIAQLSVSPIQQTALSAFSRLTTPQAIGEAYFRITRVCAAIGCPVFFGAASVAPDLVVLVFGAQWEPSGIIMAVLALAFGPQSLGYFIQPALIAAGRPRTLLIASLVAAIATLVAALSTVWWGVLTIAVGNTVQQYLAIPFRLQLMSRALGMSQRRFLVGIAPWFVCALVMAATIMAVRFAWLVEMPLVCRFSISVVIGAVLYPVLTCLTARKQIGELVADILPLLPNAMQKAWRRATGAL